MASQRDMPELADEPGREQQRQGGAQEQHPSPANPAAPEQGDHADGLEQVGQRQIEPQGIDRVAEARRLQGQGQPGNAVGIDDRHLLRRDQPPRHGGRKPPGGIDDGVIARQHRRHVSGGSLPCGGILPDQAEPEGGREQQDGQRQGGEHRPFAFHRQPGGLHGVRPFPAGTVPSINETG